MPSKYKNIKPPTEAEEQKAFVQWLKFMNIAHTAVTNEQQMSSQNKLMALRSGAKQKAMGRSKGFPDMIIILEDKCLFIEMKRVKGSTTSKEQKVWIETLNGLGHHSKVCKGAKEAIEFVELYLPERKKKINVKQGKLDV